MTRKPSLSKMQVLWDNILIEPIIEEESYHGVVKPMQYEDKSDIGIVIKVGLGAMYVKKGDLITFNKYSPTKLKIDGKDYLYIREEDVISRQE